MVTPKSKTFTQSTLREQRALKLQFDTMKNTKYIKFKKYNLENFIAFIFLLLLLESSCTTPISMIQKKPEKYEGKKVRISGKIISSIRLVDIMCFTVKDKSGKICVVTKNYLPIQGGYIFVQGIVERNYQYENRNLLVIKEYKLKARKVRSWKNTKNKL